MDNKLENSSGNLLDAESQAKYEELVSEIPNCTSFADLASLNVDAFIMQITQDYSARTELAEIIIQLQRGGVTHDEMQDLEERYAHLNQKQAKLDEIVSNLDSLKLEVFSKIAA